MNGGFLPVSRKEMKERGWDQVDFVYISRKYGFHG